MRADFSLLLVVLTLITGVLWALDRYRWEPRRRLAAAYRSRVGIRGARPGRADLSLG